MKIFEEKGYTYEKHLSKGGEGEVHLLKSVDKKFVAKIFPTLSKSSVNILKAIQSLNISGIPSIHDIFDYEDKTIVIRDYVEGTTLYDEITKNEYLSLKRAKTIILKISEILRQLHNAKPKPIIYRDLKPENIIITPKGDVKLIDFGIARYYNQESTRDTVLAGTKGYTAPEVMAGMQSDTRSDVYSAGLLFYEMLTGKSLLVPPFQIRPVRESNELLPEWIDSVIEKATDLNQTKRHRTIEEFIDAIENPKLLKKRRGLSGRSFKVIGIAIAVVIIIAGALLIIDNLDRVKALFSEEDTAGSSSVLTSELVTATNDSSDVSVINSVFIGGLKVFEETKEQLLSNNAQNIGTTDDERQATEEGIKFTADDGQRSSIIFLRELNDFEQIVGNNQAFYMKFKPSTNNFAVELTAETNAGISVEEGELFLVAEGYNYKESLDANIIGEPDNWYHILLAMGSDGLIQGAIWQGREEYNVIYFNLHLDASFSGDCYSGKSWQANVIYEDEMIIEEYAYYTFGDFQEGDRIIETNQDSDSYEVLLDLQFDELSDYDWLYLIRNDEYHIADEGSFSDFAEDGVFNMEYEFGMNYRFNPGDIYHIRIKPGEAEDYGTLLLLCFAPQIDNAWHEDLYEIKFENRQPFFGEVRTDCGYYNETADGAPMLVSNMWYDVIVFLDEESQAFRYLIFETEDSAKMAYGGTAVLDDWIGLEYEVYIDLYYDYWMGELNGEMPVSQVDFIRHSTGSIVGYLKENIPSYDGHADKIAEFLDTDFDTIPQERFIQHGF